MSARATGPGAVIGAPIVYFQSATPLAFSFTRSAPGPEIHVEVLEHLQPKSVRDTGVGDGDAQGCRDRVVRVGRVLGEVQGHHPRPAGGVAVTDRQAVVVEQVADAQQREHQQRPPVGRPERRLLELVDDVVGYPLDGVDDLVGVRLDLLEEVTEVVRLLGGLADRLVDELAQHLADVGGCGSDHRPSGTAVMWLLPIIREPRRLRTGNALLEVTTD